MLVALRVVLPNVLKLRRLAKGRLAPVQVAQPAVQGRVPGANVAHVALEVLHVDDVEADNGRVQADVGLGELRAEVVGSGGADVGRGEVGLSAVEGAEERGDGLFVGLWLTGEAGLVDAVVDFVVGPLVRLIDLGLEVGGQEVEGGVLFGQEAVKLVVEHADYLTGLVVDYGAGLGVVQSWDGEATLIIGLDREVNVADVGEFRMEWIRSDIFARERLVWSDEAPAWRGEEMECQHW